MKNLDETKKIFADRLRKIVGDASQKEIADKIDTTRQNVGNWLSEKFVPDVCTLSQIAKAYNVSVDYLLGHTDYKTPNRDIKCAMEYTGLSESAIQALNSNIVNGRFRIGGHAGLVLSSLLSSEETYFLLDHIYEYIHLLDCSNAIKWLIGFFIRESWHGLFNDIDDNEAVKIIATVKEFVAYTTTYTVKEPLHDITLNDGDDIASYFEWVRQSFDDNTDLLSYKLSKHFNELICDFSDPIPINAIVDNFKDALELNELSPAAIEKVISRMNEELQKKAGD